jgi:hypothetical protein
LDEIELGQFTVANRFAASDKPACYSMLWIVYIVLVFFLTHFGYGIWPFWTDPTEWEPFLTYDGKKRFGFQKVFGKPGDKRTVQK